MRRVENSNIAPVSRFAVLYFWQIGCIKDVQSLQRQFSFHVVAVLLERAYKHPASPVASRMLPQTGRKDRPPNSVL